MQEDIRRKAQAALQQMCQKASESGITEQDVDDIIREVRATRKEKYVVRKIPDLKLTSELHETLQQLMDDTRQALKKAYEKRMFLDDFEHVHWSNLDCVDASVVLNIDGEVHFRVVVQEASPSAHELQEIIEGYLYDRGWPLVEVVTQW